MIVFDRQCPKPILNAILDDAYSGGVQKHLEWASKNVKGFTGQHLSITTGSKSPRQKLLFQRHHEEIVMDPFANVWRLLGQSVHSMLEKFAEEGDLVEQRMGIMVGDVYFHGQADSFNPQTGILRDYKVSSAKSALYEAKVDYEFQLNALRYIFAHAKGWHIRHLENTFIYRDWKSREYKEGGKYPEHPINTIAIPVWDDAKTLQYIEDLVGRHQSAEGLADDDLPYCTALERWEKDDEHKVIKLELDGTPQKVGKYRTNSKLEAEDFIVDAMEKDWAKLVEANEKLKKPKEEAELKAKVQGYIVQTYKGTAVRCGFCEGRDFCCQIQNELRAEIHEEQEDSHEP